MSKDYYKILELSEDDKKLSTDDFKKKVKKNYRNLSLKYHPDKTNGDKSLEEKFKELSEANEILSDEEKRYEYDHPKRYVNINDMFNNFYNQPQTEHIIKGKSFKILLNLTLEEINSGSNKTISYSVNRECKECNGYGTNKLSDIHVCDICDGRGFNTNIIYGHRIIKSNCEKCKGIGKIIINPCSICEGMGLITITEDIKIDIPLNIVHGETLIFKGYGCSSPNKIGVNGDLLIIVNELPHPKFVRVNNKDLLIEINVNIIDILLGCKVTVEDINNEKFSFTIPPNTNNEKIFKLKNKGLRSFYNNGDLLVKVCHIFPKQINNKEKNILEKLKKSENFS